MQIRGLTAEQIELALERASTRYNGNLRIDGTSVMEDIEPYEKTATYRSRNYETGKLEEHSYTYTVDRRYVKDVPEPINKKGDAFKMRLKVHSSRRPGSRVSPSRWGSKVRRVASACWHANREFYREIFAINPNARIRTALAHYKGEEDFEEKYHATGYGHDGPFGYPICGIGTACNCDEGDYPEFAVEGLSEEQYKERAYIWADYPECSSVKAPKFRQAVIHSYLGGPSASLVR